MRTAHTSPASADTIRGVALMSAAMLTVPLVDGAAKHLSAEYSPLFISWARYAVACLVVLPIAYRRFGRAMFPREALSAHLLRTVFLLAAMTLYFLAIAEIPLALAISAYFIGPIVAVLLSALVLGEKLTPRKLLSLGLGAAGAMVILRPSGELQTGVLLAFGAGVFFALYLVATKRAARGSDPLQTLAFQCLAGAVLLAPQAAATASAPALDALWLFAGLGVVSALSHFLSIAAFRWADASTLAPLVYLELIGSAIIGYLAFQEVPSDGTILGAALIVLGGAVLLARQDGARG